ncbi:MAG: hypothetical protein F6K31_41985, partial [Symploca sp. SIO2G7]|nr:hypothetical protein [Symploca sp. SIO2G7]
MSLASAFTLSRLSADLTYDLSRAPEVPEEIAVQSAVSRGKVMVLLESPNVHTVPENYVFAQVETLIRHRLEINGLPVEADPLGATGRPIPIKVYLKQRDLPKPSAVHRFNWLLQDSSGPTPRNTEALNDQVFEPFFTQQPEVAPEGLFKETDKGEVTSDLSEQNDQLGQGHLFGEELPSSEEFLSDGELPSSEE